MHVGEKPATQSEMSSYSHRRAAFLPVCIRARLYVGVNWTRSQVGQSSYDLFATLDHQPETRGLATPVRGRGKRDG